MGHGLAKRVYQVQFAARRLRWLYGLALVLAAVATAIVGLLILDYWLRWEMPLIRWTFSTAALSILVFAFGRFLLPNVAQRQDVISTARQIELHFPQLHEQLSSAVAFLKQADTDP